MKEEFTVHSPNGGEVCKIKIEDSDDKVTIDFEGEYCSKLFKEEIGTSPTRL